MIECMTAMIKINKKRMRGLFTVPLLSILVGSATAQEKKLEALNVAYTSATPTRSPLWIAKEVGLFEKYGIDAKLIYIRAGSPSISALVSGDMHVSSDPAAAAAIAAARGAPIVVVGTYGLASYRLVAHPAIGSIRNLKGRSIGSVRPGSGPDALLHRFLPKLGLVPGRDVTILPTGIAESNKRIIGMLQGNFDATLASWDNIVQLEITGQKVNVLADPTEFGVRTSVSDLTSTRQVVRDRRAAMKAFFRAFVEAISLGKKDRELAFRIFRKYLRVDDTTLLASMHRNYLGTIPIKPYPLDDALEADIEYLSQSLVPELKGKHASDYIDASVIREIENENFFARLER
ncbi:MAG: ABC transporter substrate-binding protein [Deltaproteobacteria bacterium]|nr:MAG: ABC transporter substrate-binding protein [Deltaproteobacteria bacterium]